MGDLVTNTGSQLGCGHSWPLCKGTVVPGQFSGHTWVEFGHRFITGIVGIIVVLQFILVFIRLKKNIAAKTFASLCLLFVIIQAFMGGAAVMWPQSSVILALHFGISLIAFGSSVLATLVIFESTGNERVTMNPSKGVKWNNLLLIIYIYIVVYAGAFVRHSHSSMGCGTEWPLCNGKFIPSLYTPAGVQTIHRFLAYILFIWIVLTMINAFKKYHNTNLYVLNGVLAFIFVILQAMSGILIVFTSMDLLFLILHAVFVTCLFGNISIMLWLALREPSRSQV